MAKRKKAARPRTPARTSARKSIRIRMYRVGFGDCFLVSIPARAGVRHLLFDFGVHPSGQVGTMAEVMKDIIAVTGRKLALLVASHEHADHIAGFGQFADVFREFSIGQIWMPWAMDPEDRTAIRLRAAQLQLAGQLLAHFQAAPGSPAALQAVLNFTKNVDSVRALRTGFDGAGPTRYLTAGDRIEDDFMPGVQFRVLGPPTDPAFIRKMLPPANQRYLRPALEGEPQVVSVNGIMPFPRYWQPTLEEARAALATTAADEDRIRATVSGSVDNVALALDSGLNNTSLSLLITSRGKSLLFPGDAQYGNWKFWLDQPGSATLLDQVAFLKVAHHGSHNATPRSALEGMPSKGFAAMSSTQSKPWPSIPQKELVKAIQERTGKRYVQSDQIAGGTVKLPRGFKRGKSLWIDYTLPL
jgi:beta-lactamase superfamily II metal-dependent hydrolase